MKIERTKNATRNIIFGSLLKVYQILVPFLMRTLMIYFMGVQYVGLNSLFVSILQVLNLVELGVGNAMVYSMYKPIVEDDSKTICALLRLYKIYYTIIGFIVAILGVALCPFIPSLIKGDVPADINVYIIYLLNLAATVLSYWLFAYKNSLLTAHQRGDVASKVMLFTNTFQYALQIFAICVLKDYYVYLIVILATQAMTNVVTAYLAKKMYPNYKAAGELDKSLVRDINCRIRDLFTSKLGAVVVNSVDTLVISAFLGLTILAIYQNYYFILSSVVGVVSIVFGAVTAGIGNSVIVESKEKNLKDLKKFTLIIAWIAGFCACCLICLYQPFMEIWVGKEMQLTFGAVVLFGVYYFIVEINALLNTYKDAAGIWREDRFRPLVTAIVNLSLNLVMVQFWGIYGVLLSTVLSMLIVGMPWLLYNLFTTLFEKKQMKSYVKMLVRYVLVTTLAIAVTYMIGSWIQLQAGVVFVIRALICMVVPNIVFYVCYCKTEEFREGVLLVDRITKGKLSLEKRLLRRK